MASTYQEDLYLKAAAAQAQSQVKLNEALIKLINAQTAAQIFDNTRKGF